MAPKMNRPMNSKVKDRTSSSPVPALLSEAEKIKKQAERKADGLAKEVLLLQCEKLLQQALANSHSSPKEDEIIFDLGEVYALLGSTAQAKMYYNLGNIFSSKLLKETALNIQSNATKQSGDFYRKSHEMYEKVVARNSPELKQESLINSGNSLCDWAELLPPAEGLSLLEQADLRYTAALSTSQDDVELLTNLGDCKVKRAEYEMEIGNSLSNPQTWVRAKELFGSAMAAYGHAYSLADASVGDDVAGLLQNWGAGLSSLAVHTLDPEEALLAHEQAMEKLRNAAKLRPTDSSIFIAIGEACCAHVDRVQVAVSLKLLATAIEEGFGTALRIDSACLDSVLGRAEAHLAAGRINASAGMDFDAQNHHNLSLNYYLNALQILKADTRNGCKLKFEEQCNVLYNIACVAALCNKESIAAEALTLLVQVGGLSPSDLADDSDFQNLRPKEWFVSLQKH